MNALTVSLPSFPTQGLINKFIFALLCWYIHRLLFFFSAFRNNSEFTLPLLFSIYFIFRGFQKILPLDSYLYVAIIQTETLVSSILYLYSSLILYRYCKICVSSHWYLMLNSPLLHTLLTPFTFSKRHFTYAIFQDKSLGITLSLYCHNDIQCVQEALPSHLPQNITRSYHFLCLQCSPVHRYLLLYFLRGSPSDFLFLTFYV